MKKKWMALIFSGMMALSMAACSGGSSTKETSAGTQTSAETAAVGTEAVESSSEETGESGSGSQEYTGRMAEIMEKGVLTVVTSPDYPPYEFVDLTKSGQDQYVGADMKLAQYIADAMGVDLKIDAMNFDSCMACIGEGRADLAICGMVPKEERKTSMDFSDVYYNDGDQVVVILAENADKYQTLADFQGQKVAAQNATLQSELVTDQIGADSLESITSIQDGIMMLRSGKVAGLALASVAADNYLANYDDLTTCAEQFEYTSLGVVAGVVKDEPDLLRVVNSIIDEVVESGIYFQWIDEANQLSSELQG